MAAAAILTNVIVLLSTAPPSQKAQDEVMNLRYLEQMTYKNGEVWLNEAPKQ